MGHSLKVGVVVVAMVGLALSSVAIARAVDDPPAEGERTGARQSIATALGSLVEDGTLIQEQADAVVHELVPIVERARFQDRTKALIKRLGRLAAETAEVLAMTPTDLRDQLEVGMTLAEVADANGSSGLQLVADVTDHIAAHLAVQVTAGRLDQAQADEVVAKTARTLSELIDVEHPFRTVLEERRNRAVRGAALNSGAAMLGLSIDELRALRADGNSLAEIAAVKGVAEDDLISSLLVPITEWIGEAVERGRRTEVEAAEALEEATQRVAEAIQREPGT